MGKAVWDVLMNLLSRARGSQFKLLHLKGYGGGQILEEGQSKAAFAACKRAGMYLHPSIDFCVGGQWTHAYVHLFATPGIWAVIQSTHSSSVGVKHCVCVSP